MNDLQIAAQAVSEGLEMTTNHLGEIERVRVPHRKLGQELLNALGPFRNAEMLQRLLCSQGLEQGRGGEVRK